LRNWIIHARKLLRPCRTHGGEARFETIDSLDEEETNGSERI
jgi:hypothetical protein